MKRRKTLTHRPSWKNRKINRKNPHLKRSAVSGFMINHPDTKLLDSFP